MVASPTPAPLRDPRAAIRADLERDVTAGANALKLDADDDDRTSTLRLTGGRCPAPRRQRGGRGAGDRRLRGRARRRPGDRTGARRGPHQPRSVGRPARRAHPDPAARDRVDRGRRLRAVRRRLLRPRSPAHPRPGPGRRRRRRCWRRTTRTTPTPRSTRAGSSRPSSPPPGGSIRGTRGGPNWSVLVAAVMAVVLVWSIARLVMDSSDPVPPAQPASPTVRADPTARPRPPGRRARARSCSPPPEVAPESSCATPTARSSTTDSSRSVSPYRSRPRRRCGSAPPTARSRSPSTVEDEGPLGATGQQGQDTYVVR